MMATKHHDSFEDVMKPLIEHLNQDWHNRKADDPNLCSGNYLDEVEGKVSSYIRDNWSRIRD
ncbi:hypothetical protein LCGC14_1857150 [marine sediment metagenome]|uniref:Uncharacterized protein n=1 Tax=marine sediment metagenome TaxID=412755 RepID=A0A0F9J7P0_9ZZZZ